MGRTGSSSLRQVLKRETAHMHDTLDSMLVGEALASSDDYARFLLTQYQARKPIEEWVARNLPSDEAPPIQTPLVAQDLAELGMAVPAATGRFAMPAGAAPIGLRWALAGSSLGNRAMLVQRRKAGLDGPDSFLADDAMPSYFRALRPVLERDVDEGYAGAAVVAASAVFTCFLAALDPMDAAA